jgi:hypothetical protein
MVMRQSGKKATKKTAKKAVRKSAAPKTEAKKQAAKLNGKQGGKKRRTIKSTVPLRFRELPKLGEANDPRFWELRSEFKDYFKSLPDEEVEPFLDGLKRPFVDYLSIELAQESWRNSRKAVGGRLEEKRRGL